MSLLFIGKLQRSRVVSNFNLWSYGLVEMEVASFMKMVVPMHNIMASKVVGDFRHVASKLLC